MELTCTALVGCTKKPSNEAADEEDPETYVQRYVEEDSESRTTLGVFFSCLLCR
jgi:hypothetical protein